MPSASPAGRFQQMRPPSTPNLGAGRGFRICALQPEGWRPLLALAKRPEQGEIFVGICED